MIRRVADRLSETIQTLVINARQDQQQAIATAMEGYPWPTSYQLDEQPDQGPLVGILTGLRGVNAEYVFVAACDMPFIDPEVVELLFTRAKGSDGAVPRPDDWYQPTHAVYRTEAMRKAGAKARDHEQDRIVHAIDRLQIETISADEIDRVGSLETFENINTPTEFEAAIERVTGNEIN